MKCFMIVIIFSGVCWGCERDYTCEKCQNFDCYFTEGWDGEYLCLELSRLSGPRPFKQIIKNCPALKSTLPPNTEEALGRDGLRQFLMHSESGKEDDCSSYKFCQNCLDRACRWVWGRGQGDQGSCHNVGSPVPPSAEFIEPPYGGWCPRVVAVTSTTTLTPETAGEASRLGSRWECWLVLGFWAFCGLDTFFFALRRQKRIRGGKVLHLTPNAGDLRSNSNDGEIL